MQGYSKVSLRPIITVHYNGYVVASMQDYRKESLGPFMAAIIMAN
jgi:hypothetical protein